MSVLGMHAAGAAAVAAAELDSASVGPFLLSRPIFLASGIGALLGDPWRCAALGAAFEALTLEELPLGGRLELSAGFGAGIAAWLVAGPTALAPEAAFVWGLAAAFSHARMERFLRSRRAGAARAEDRVRRGQEPRLGLEVLAALGGQAAASFALALAFLAGGGFLLAAAWPRVPEIAAAGIRAAYLAAPWIGAGSLAASLWRPR